jgi:5-formyltetrahydrofolate cyclo-ligase
MGRGKGYYDRFLPQLEQAYKIGVCFDFQKMPGIQTEENDVRMDIVI